MIAHDFTPGRQLVLRTPGEYSMEAAFAILHWLARRDGCAIMDDGWRTPGYGNLVEVGIEVQLDSIRFRVLCSYEDIFVDRVAGNKDGFSVLCDEVQGLELETT